MLNWISLVVYSCDISSNLLASGMFGSDFCIHFLICGVGRVQHSVCLCEATNVLRDPIRLATCEGIHSSCVLRGHT